MSQKALVFIRRIISSFITSMEEDTMEVDTTLSQFFPPI